MKRSSRLLLLYVLAVAIYLPLSLLFPIWILIIGPIMWGVPHIFSSMRYLGRFFDDSVQPRFKSGLSISSFQLFGLIWLMVMVLRLLADHQAIGSSLPFNWPEVLSVGATVLAFGIFYRGSLRVFTRQALVAVPLIFCAWKNPALTSGILILAHNFVAFYYWVMATKTKPERNVAIFASLSFILIHVLIFAGAFDWVYGIVNPVGTVSWAGMDYGVIGQSIASWSSDYHVWFHCVVVYAFGQSLHYFVWMKAIPDQTHKNEAATSFRSALHFLKQDLGTKTAIATIVISLAYFAFWVFQTMPDARAIYFIVAGYHGYMEMSSIGLVGKKA
jgi:hypothetical protein